MSLDVNKFLIEEIKYFVIMPIVMLYICDEINSRTASDFSVAFILWMCWYSFYPLISSIRIHTKPKQPLPIYAYLVMLAASTLMYLAGKFLYYRHTSNISYVQMQEIILTTQYFFIILLFSYSCIGFLSYLTNKKD